MKNKFWDISPSGRLFKKAGDIMIRPYSSNPDGDYGYIFVSKFSRGQILRLGKNEKQKLQYIDNVKQSEMIPISYGMKINILTPARKEKWYLSEAEKKLVKSVNEWLKKNIKKKQKSIQRNA